MSDQLVALIDPDGLAGLVGRLANFRRALEEIEALRNDLQTSKNPNDPNPTWFGACRQLIAVLEFVEDSKDLMPELHELLNALIDLENGREVVWLRPTRIVKKRPPLSFEESAIHARYAAIMDWLIAAGGKGKKEAAEFVVTHGGLRRWLEKHGRRPAGENPPALDWVIVANWRDRMKNGTATDAERTLFEGQYEILNAKTGGGIEAIAKKALRQLKIYFSLG
jgi:hypothetical protein